MNKEPRYLIADSVRFYSSTDEDVFFNWLDKISCISNYEGFGTELRLNLNPKLIDEDSIRELTAIFIRYGIDKLQLEALKMKIKKTN